MRFKRLAALSALVLLAAPALSGCFESSPSPSSSAAPAASNADAGPVLAKVGGMEIRQADVDAAEEDLGSELANVPDDQKRDQVVTYLADVLTVAKAAEANKLADTPEFNRRMALMRSKLLMGMQLQAVGKAAITEAAEQDVYNNAIKAMGTQEEVHARHILVATEDEANEIVKQLRDGADFAALAKDKSKDPGASDGGDLGFFTKDQMVKEFSDVAFKMYPGQISNPVKTQFGWHVIKLEEKREKAPPAFEQVKDQIDAYLSRKAQTDYVAQLREANKVEFLDKPAAAAAPAAPAKSDALAPAPTAGTPANPVKK